MKVEATFGRSEQKGAYIRIFIPEAPEESREIHLYLNDLELTEKMELFSLLELKSIVVQCKEFTVSTDPTDIPFAYKDLLTRMEIAQGIKTSRSKI